MVSAWFLLTVAKLAPMMGWLRRYLRFSLCRRMLCPVGAVFEGARTQPPHGVRYCVLWVDRHHRTRRSTTPKPYSGTHPVTPESHHLALCVNISDFAYPSGIDSPPVPRTAIHPQVDRLVHDIPAPSHGWGHYHCTSPTHILRHHLFSLTMHADRFIGCITSTIGILSYVSFPQ